MSKQYAYANVYHNSHFISEGVALEDGSDTSKVADPFYRHAPPSATNATQYGSPSLFSFVRPRINDSTYAASPTRESASTYRPVVRRPSIEKAVKSSSRYSPESSITSYAHREERSLSPTNHYTSMNYSDDRMSNRSHSRPRDLDQVVFVNLGWVSVPW